MLKNHHGLAGADGLHEKYSFTAAGMREYRMYPIADNGSTRLSADRLEYTLGNAPAHDLTDVYEIHTIYDDLLVCANEAGEPEQAFLTEARRALFVALAGKFPGIFLQRNSLCHAGAGGHFAQRPCEKCDNGS